MPGDRGKWNKNESTSRRHTQAVGSARDCGLCTDAGVHRYKGGWVDIRTDVRNPVMWGVAQKQHDCKPSLTFFFLPLN